MKNCIFCSIVSGQVQSLKIYEDQDIIAVLDIYPANPAHVLIFPKQHIQYYNQLPDSTIGKMFVLAKYISNVIQNVLKAEGFNLYLASGEVAGQRVPHVVLHLIPRYKNDGLQFEWNRKQVDFNTLSQIQQAISNNLKNISTSTPIAQQTYQPSTKTSQQHTSSKKEEKESKSAYEKMLYWFRRKR